MALFQKSVLKKFIAELNEDQNKVQKLQSKINRLDSEIDQVVYELYGLKEAEIKLVKGK